MKQVIVVDELLRLPRGKLAAQVAHASISAFLKASPDAQEAWLSLGMPKVILRGEGVGSLYELEARAANHGIPAALIEDAGKTVVTPGTATCVGIGPAPASAIDELTALLRLVR
jgi:PTH2 family peptidyl-tRNA hydrolase